MRKRNGGAETELCHEDEAGLSEVSEGTAGATVTGMLSILKNYELYPKIQLICREEHFLKLYLVQNWGLALYDQSFRRI